MAAISVLIPIYNAEKYLDKCLDSLIRQAFQDWEAICINDGSTDSSINILSKYSEKDKRIKTFSQENSGIAKAYEKAVKESKGEWIYLLDNDDWLEDDALQYLLETAKNNDADLVYTVSLNKYYEKNKLSERFQHMPWPFKNGDNTLFKIYTGPYKFFKKSLYKNVIFPDKLCDYQDTCLSWQISLNTKKPVIINDKACYNWRIRDNSVSHTQYKDGEKLFRDFKETYNAIENFMIKSEFDDIWRRQPLYDWAIRRLMVFAEKKYKNLNTKIIFNEFKILLNKIPQEIDATMFFKNKNIYNIIQKGTYKDFKKEFSFLNQLAKKFKIMIFH